MTAAIAENRLAKVAGVIGCMGRLPHVRVVSDVVMRLNSFNPLRPPPVLVCNRDGSGDLLVVDPAHALDDDATIVHELSHHLLRTSQGAGLYPHAESDVDGHGPLFSAVCWSLRARARLPLPDGREAAYDLGRWQRPGDRPASQAEERWARRWAARAHGGAAEALAAKAIHDYARWGRWQARKAKVRAALLPLLRFAAVMAAGLTLPSLLAHVLQASTHAPPCRGSERSLTRSTPAIKPLSCPLPVAKSAHSHGFQ